MVVDQPFFKRTYLGKLRWLNLLSPSPELLRPPRATGTVLVGSCVRSHSGIILQHGQSSNDVTPSRSAACSQLLPAYWCAASGKLEVRLQTQVTYKMQNTQVMWFENRGDNNKTGDCMASASKQPGSSLKSPEVISLCENCHLSPKNRSIHSTYLVGWF